MDVRGISNHSSLHRKNRHLFLKIPRRRHQKSQFTYAALDSNSITNEPRIKLVLSVSKYQDTVFRIISPFRSIAHRAASLTAAGAPPDEQER